MLGKRIVCSAILVLACGAGAAAQNAPYPARPIKMIVPSRREGRSMSPPES